MSLQTDVSGLIQEKLPLAWKIFNWYGDWAIRFMTLGSLVLTSVIIISAGTRRQFRCRVSMSILLVAYKYKPKAAEYAMTHLVFKSTVTAQEQQLVSFWATFLLLQLAGPDNIAAFALEDGKISAREVIEAAWNIAQGIYVMVKYIYFCNSGVLRTAASIMLVLSVLRYIEKVVAQLRGNFDNLWGSKKKHKPPPASTVGGECRDEGRLTGILLKAHPQFRACGHRAMSDSSVDTASHDHRISQEIFSPDTNYEIWELVGMEASLMYDILYTKARVVHTWGGYLLRLASPPCTAAALIFFCLSPQDCEETRDIVVTYILLVTTLFLDMVWLLSALASTWTHSYLNARANMWLHRALLCGGWWHLLRRMVVSLEMWWWWLLGKEKDYSTTSPRMWSGRVGRYKLLAECTRRSPSRVERLCTWLASQLSLDEMWNESQHWRCISELELEEKKLLFNLVKQRLHGSNAYSMKAVTTDWGQEAVRRSSSKATTTDKLKVIIKNLEQFFGREFQEDILLWHIGTAIFLARSRGSKPLSLITDDGDGNNQWKTTVLAIEALSEYLMFLFVVRPRMLPGLQLRKLFKVTCKALKDSWGHRKQQVGTKWVHCYASGKEKQLADVLYDEMSKYKKESDIHDANERLIWVGNQLATELLKVKKEDDMKELLELMLDVWVDKMLYAAIRCNKDSHAKQLGRGGELTTIVWIVAEHAGLFRIEKKHPDRRIDDPPPYRCDEHCGGCPCEKLDEKKKKICHQDQPHVCPNISCAQDYCCTMDDYYYC